MVKKMANESTEQEILEYVVKATLKNNRKVFQRLAEL